ncbi:MAG TPA: PAS domain S-box protein [Ohtaekwangia sp.]|nr:PAS domain S-box protein [Ohtaekwangia sp.]
MGNTPVSETLFPNDDSPDALAEANRLQKAIIDATQIAIFSTSPDGTITTFNTAAENLLGYTAKELIRKQSPLLFYEKTAIEAYQQRAVTEGEKNIQALGCFVGKAGEKKSTDRSECNYIRKDGSVFPASVSVTALLDKKNRIAGFVGVVTDLTEQKKIDRMRRESEEHLQALITSLDDIVFELDENGRFTHIWVKNDDYLFLPRQQIYGRTLAEMFGESFARPIENGFREVLKSGKTFHYEYKTLSGGEDRWYNAKYALIYDQQKPTNRVSVCIQDITARKKAEISLRQNEERFRLLAENIPGTIYLCRKDENNTVLFISDNVETLTGYTAEEFLSGSVNFFQLCHPDDEREVTQAIADALEKKVKFDLQHRIIDKSAKVRWIEAVGIGVYTPDGALQMIEGYLSDISQRRMAEEAFKRVADENDRIFNYSLNLNAVTNFEGYFLKLNPAWERTLGWTVEDLTSRKFIEFVHPDDRQKTSGVYESLIEGLALPAFENRYRARDGSYRWLLWTSSPDFKHRTVYASAIDITDRKKSEEDLLLSKKNLEVAALELEDQNRQLDEFAHIISHNLRSPAGNIMALTNFINESSTHEDYRIIFEKIRKVASNLNETMNELMETLKVKNNKEVERVEIRFKDMLDKVVQSLEGELIQCGATVTFDFNDAPKITYAKAYLESIFQNLLSNAVKYRSPERKAMIHVVSSLVDDTITLRITDNGLGMDLEKYGAKLFGLHKTFHENKEARGVGLFLTKTQIEAMGGSISAESEVNKGTTFIIRF